MKNPEAGLKAIEAIMEALDDSAIKNVFGEDDDKMCPECEMKGDECICEKDEEIKKKMPKVEIMSVSVGKKKPKTNKLEEPY